MVLDLLRIGDTIVTDLVEGVGRFQNQHAERDFLAGVEGGSSSPTAACRHGKAKVSEMVPEKLLR